MHEKKIDGIRNGDHPEYKEKIMSQLFGEFIGFLKAQGLTDDKEFATQIVEIFQCSKKVLWIDEVHPDLQLTVCLNSIEMFAELGIANKKTKVVSHRNKIEGLRYNISPDSFLELTSGSKEKFDSFFSDFKKQFETLKQK